MKRTIFEGILPESKAMPEVEVGSLMMYLEKVVDPRDAKGIRYQLVHLLTLLILAKMGGEDTLRGMTEWVKLRGEALVALLKLPRPTLPHQTTYERVLDKLDIEAFEQQVSTYFAGQMVEGETINVDGKTLRGSIPAGETRGVHLLAGYAVQQGVVLRQVAVEDKSNEITAAPRLLADLDLCGKVVTGDAMLTQRALCTQIVEAGAITSSRSKTTRQSCVKPLLRVFSPCQTVMVIQNRHSQTTLLLASSSNGDGLNIAG